MTTSQKATKAGEKDVTVVSFFLSLSAQFFLALSSWSVYFFVIIWRKNIWLIMSSSYSDRYNNYPGEILWWRRNHSDFDLWGRCLHPEILQGLSCTEYYSCVVNTLTWNKLMWSAPKNTPGAELYQVLFMCSRYLGMKYMNVVCTQKYSREWVVLSTIHV